MAKATVIVATTWLMAAAGDLACAYKTNLAFYEMLGMPGLRALEATVGYIRQAAAQCIVIGDAKRGDIDGSAVAMFGGWGVDAVIINPWGGMDTVEPWLDWPERGWGGYLVSGFQSRRRDWQDLPVSTSGEICICGWRGGRRNGHCRTMDTAAAVWAWWSERRRRSIWRHPAGLPRYAAADTGRGRAGGRSGGYRAVRGGCRRPQRHHQLIARDYLCILGAGLCGGAAGYDAVARCHQRYAGRYGAGMAVAVPAAGIGTGRAGL